MREITSHKAHEQDRQPRLYALENPTIAGAEQNYQIHYAEDGKPFTVVQLDFVSLEHAGVTNEVLLAVIIDRLEGFQAGKFPCKENEVALNHARSALTSLQARTLDRVARGVESQAKA